MGKSIGVGAGGGRGLKGLSTCDKLNYTNISYGSFVWFQFDSKL